MPRDAAATEVAAMAGRSPKGLSAGGRALWKAVTDAHELDAIQEAQLLEACRAKDRLDRLDEVLRGEVDTWARLAPLDEEGATFELVIDRALDKANATANVMKQLFAAMRLPDEETGKRPQRRGARGTQRPSVPGGATVSSLDRARQAAGA
jgi:hypothetical protein